MTNRLTLHLTLLLMLAGYAGSLFASADLSGQWEVKVKGPAAHGDSSATLVLAQNKETVTGTLHAHGNEHKLGGTFKDGTLQLETTDTPADRSLSLTAKLQADGSLAGFLSGPMGDMKWTASRVKDAS